MNNRMKIRPIVTIILGIIFIVSACFSLYYLKFDKGNANISGVMTVALCTLLLTLGNVIVLGIRRRRKK